MWFIPYKWFINFIKCHRYNKHLAFILLYYTMPKRKSKLFLCKSAMSTWLRRRGLRVRSRQRFLFSKQTTSLAHSVLIPSAKSHTRLTCSVVSLTTVCCCCQLLAGFSPAQEYQSASFLPLSQTNMIRTHLRLAIGSDLFFATPRGPHKKKPQIAITSLASRGK